MIAKPASLTETLLNLLALENANDALDVDLFNGAEITCELSPGPSNAAIGLLMG